MRMIKIWFLRRRMKRLLLELRSIQDGYSCGASMLIYVSTEYRRLKIRLNDCIEALSKLDPRAAHLKPFEDWETV